MGIMSAPLRVKTGIFAAALFGMGGLLASSTALGGY